MTTLTAPSSARARVREELTREIKESARRQLNEVGSAALSLRAVARDLNMASSALYRYFPSRDDLLTALIVDAYESVGAAAEAAEASVRRTDFSGRWLAATRAVRSWALARPQEYALIFGSPVPGYRAPQDTVTPAATIPLLLVSVIIDAQAADRYPPAVEKRPMPRAVRADLKGLRQSVAPSLGEAHLGRALLAWTALIGCVSFELFGHLHRTVHDYEAYFDFQMRNLAADVGLD